MSSVQLVMTSSPDFALYCDSCMQMRSPLFSASPSPSCSTAPLLFSILSPFLNSTFGFSPGLPVTLTPSSFGSVALDEALDEALAEPSDDPEPQAAMLTHRASALTTDAARVIEVTREVCCIATNSNASARFIRPEGNGVVKGRDL